MCSESCATAPLAILCRSLAVQPRDSVEHSQRRRALEGRNAAEQAAAFGAGSAAISKYGGAGAGDRTMLEALFPAAEAAATAAAGGAVAATLAAAATVEAGAEATKAMDDSLVVGGPLVVRAGRGAEERARPRRDGCSYLAARARHPSDVSDLWKHMHAHTVPLRRGS